MKTKTEQDLKDLLCHEGAEWIAAGEFERVIAGMKLVPADTVVITVQDAKDLVDFISTRYTEVGQAVIKQIALIEGAKPLRNQDGSLVTNLAQAMQAVANNAVEEVGKAECVCILKDRPSAQAVCGREFIQHLTSLAECCGNPVSRNPNIFCGHDRACHGTKA